MGDEWDVPSRNLTYNIAVESGHLQKGFPLKVGIFHTYVRHYQWVSPIKASFLSVAVTWSMAQIPSPSPRIVGVSFWTLLAVHRKSGRGVFGSWSMEQLGWDWWLEDCATRSLNPDSPTFKSVCLLIKTPWWISTFLMAPTLVPVNEDPVMNNLTFDDGIGLSVV